MFTNNTALILYRYDKTSQKVGGRHPQGNMLAFTHTKCNVPKLKQIMAEKTQVIDGMPILFGDFRVRTYVTLSLTPNKEFLRIHPNSDPTPPGFEPWTC